MIKNKFLLLFCILSLFLIFPINSYSAIPQSVLDNLTYYNTMYWKVDNMTGTKSFDYLNRGNLTAVGNANITINGILSNKTTPINTTNYFTNTFRLGLNTGWQTTTSLWIYMNSSLDTSSHDIIWVQDGSSSSSADCKLQVGYNGTHFRANFFRGTQFSSSVSSISALNQTANGWYHILAVQNGQSITLYQNGINGTAGNTGGYSCSGAGYRVQNYIGYNTLYNSTCGACNMNFDEIAFFSKALNQTEINALYYNGTPFNFYTGEPSTPSVNDCNKTINTNWNLNYTLQCNNTLIDLGTGNLSIDTGGKLILSNSTLKSKNIFFNTIGDLLYILSGSFLNIGG